MRRLFSILVAASMLAVVGGVPALAGVDEEVELIELVNMSRGESGLPPLQADVGLIVAGRGHSADMARDGDLYHSTRTQLGSYASDWVLIGENVGRGPNARAIHDAFMESESHRDNVLGDYDAVGAGVDRSPDGTLFVTVVFMRRSPEAASAGPVAGGPMELIAGLPDFAVSRVQAAVEIFQRSGHDLSAAESPGGAA